MSTPTELILLPNTELVVVKYLKAQLGTDARVGLVVPKDDDILDDIPFVRVARRGGPGNHLIRFDGPMVDIDLWETTNDKANILGERLRGLMAAMRWHRDNTLGAIITKVSESTGPQRLPEENPQIVRLGFTVGLTVRSFIPA